MVKRLLLFVFVIVPSLLLAQQRPHYSQYLQNMSAINPAVTGMNNGLDLRLGLRNQWQGLKDAPKTMFASISAPLFIGTDVSNYRFRDLGVSDPTTQDEAFDYQSSDDHHGLGLLLLQDKAGPIDRTIANLTYAYHLSLAGTANLSFGVGFGVDKVSLNTSGLVFAESGDAVIANAENINKVVPDLNFGTYLYGANYYVGLSMQQIIPNKLSFNSGYQTGKDVAHYFFTGGYKFWMANDIGVTPSFMLKYVSGLPLAYDLNVMANYRGNFWLGASYRVKDALSGMFGFVVAKRVGLSYAYDYSISSIRTLAPNSHELNLAVKF